MGSDWNGILHLAGRCLMAVLFLYSALDKSLHPRAALEEVKAGGLPLPRLVLAMTLLAQWLGGLSLLTGILLPWGAMLLGGFTLVATLLFHPFWRAGVDQRGRALTGFLEHLALVGGLLALA